MLSAIAFQSPNDVNQGFRELVDRLHNVYNRDADDLLHYFEGNTFVGIEDTLQFGSQSFQLNLQIYSNEQTMNCPALTTT